MRFYPDRQLNVRTKDRLTLLILTDLRCLTNCALNLFPTIMIVISCIVPYIFLWYNYDSLPAIVNYRWYNILRRITSGAMRRGKTDRFTSCPGTWASAANTDRSLYVL
jgi:hypothetical protein